MFKRIKAFFNRGTADKEMSTDESTKKKLADTPICFGGGGLIEGNYCQCEYCAVMRNSRYKK